MLLNGAVYDTESHLKGTVRLLETEDEESFKDLMLIPGVDVIHANPRKGIKEGYTISKSIVDAGRFPIHVKHWPMDAAEFTPTREDGLALKLKTYQRQAVSFMRTVSANREGAILAGDMGLGKTLIALQALHLDGYLNRTGVICGPLIGASAWVGPNSDITKWYGIDVRKIEGSKNLDMSQLKGASIIYLHYDILESWWAWILSAFAPSFIIFDECHLLMNAKAERSEAAYKLSLWHTVERRYGLTGTPIPNRRLNLWNQLRCIQPRQWGNHQHVFGMRYCGGRRETHHEGGHFVYDDETNNTELALRLAGTLLRFTKEEVKADLPVLNRSTENLPADWIRLEAYSEAERNIKQYWAELGEEHADGAGWQLKQLSTLIALLSAYKASLAPNIIARYAQEHNRMVIFTWRRDSAQAICDGLQSLSLAHTIVGPIDGSVEHEKRRDMAQYFQTCEQGIFVATLGSAGISMNELVVASCVLFVDLYWNPATLTQAEARIHREGSQYESVRSVFLTVEGTVDELFMQHLMRKAESAQAISNQDTSALDLVSILRTGKSENEAEMVDSICKLLAEGNDDDE